MFKERMENTLKECAQNILISARENCPQKSGKLKDSLKVKMSDGKGEIYSDLPYAQKVEMGDSKTAPNPFLSKALYDNEDGFTEAMRESLEIR